MSISVVPQDLPAVARKYGGSAYVLTTGGDGRCRVTHCVVAVASGSVSFRLGRQATENARARPAISLLWAANADQPMSLIVDGTARPDSGAGDDETFILEVESAVQHRAAPT